MNNVSSHSSGNTFSKIRLGGMSADLEGYAYQIDTSEEPPKAYLWYVSMVGYKTAVQAIWAGLVNNPPQSVVLYCEDDDERNMEIDEGVEVQKEPGRKPILVQPAEGSRSSGWNFFKCQLPAACAFQGVLLPQIAFLNSPSVRNRKGSGTNSNSAENSEFLLLQPHLSGTRSRNLISEPQIANANHHAAHLAALYYARLNSLVSLPLHPLWATTLWQRALDNGEVSRLESASVVAYLCPKPDEERLQQEVAELIRLGNLTCS